MTATLTNAAMPGKNIVRSADFEARVTDALARKHAHEQARAILDAAIKEAAVRVAEAQDTAQTIREHAEQTGLAQAEAQHAARIAATMSQWQRYVQGLAPQLTALVADTVARYLGDAPVEDRVRAAVGAGLSSMETAQAVHIHVHPAHVPVIQAAIAAMAVRYPMAQILSVQADATLESTACRLITPFSEHLVSETLFVNALRDALTPLMFHDEP